MIQWRNEKRKISELIPYEHNPRQITEKQVRDLKKSLEKFGVADSLIINTDNTIIGGHQRKEILETLMQMPSDFEIDVRVPERELTDGEVKELNVRLNRNVAEWDFDVLANEFDLDELRDWGFDEKELRIFDEPEKEVIGEVEFTNELLEEHNFVVLYFENSIDWLQIQTLFGIKPVKALDSKPGYERKGVGRVIKGSDFLNKLGLDL